MALDDTIEIFGYLVGFWLFLFSKQFRMTWIEDFKNAHFIDQLFRIVGAIGSIAIGLGIPVIIIYLIIVW